MADDKKIGFQGVPDFQMPQVAAPINVPPALPGGYGRMFGMVGRGLFGTLGLIVSPDQLGDGELPQYYRDPRFWDPQFVDLDVRGNEFDVIVPGDETPVSTGFVGLDPALVNWDAQSQTYYDEEGGGPLQGGGSPLRTTSRNRSEVNRSINRPLRLDWRLSDRDAVERMPSTVRAGRILQRGRQPWLESRLDVLPASQGNVRFRVRNRTTDDRYQYRPRLQDEKLGRAGYRLGLLMVNLTYGTATEIGDFLDALMANTYGIDGQGEIRSATDLGWSYAALVRFLESGAAETDLVGFKHDFWLQQANDAVDALSGAPVDFLKSRAPYWLPGHVPGANDNSWSMQDVLSEPAKKFLRQAFPPDLSRARRVSRLFTRPASERW